MAFILVLTPREQLPPTVLFTDEYPTFFQLVKKFEKESSIHPRLTRVNLDKNRIELHFDADTEINIGHVSSYFSKPLYDLGWGVEGKDHAVFSMEVYEMTKKT